MVSIVVAQGSNRVIGRDGRLPWHLPADLRRFKAMTSGHAVVMGRKTFESLPDAVRPLPNRRNVVLSRDARYAAGPGVATAADLRAALELCDGTCFVIGGGQVYEEALPLAGRVYSTEVDAAPDGDVYFPPLPAARWRCVEESVPHEENGSRFVFRTYDRVP
jgi:dihydrofolate reductase